MSFYLPRYPPTSKERTYQSFRSQTGGFQLQQMSDPGFVTSAAPPRPHKLKLNKEGKKGIEEEGMELGTYRNIPRTGGEMCEGWLKRGCLLRGSNYSNAVLIYSCLFSSLCLQFSLHLKYNNSPGWCAASQRGFSIFLWLPLAFKQAFFYSCSGFCLFKQAPVPPVLLHLGDHVKFRVSGNVGSLLLRAHCV